MADVATKPLRELIDARREEIMAIVARHHGQSVAVFGSVARGDEQPGSDIDLLVELAPGTRPFEILALGAALEEALGVRVDVGTVAPRRDPHGSAGRGHPSVSRRDASRLRDHLAHRYFDTDHAIIQDVVETEIDPLLQAVRLLLERVDLADDS